MNKYGIKKEGRLHRTALPCDPAEDRTLDPQIKSLLLYQLSYGVKRTANVNTKEFAVKSVSIKTFSFSLPTFLYICALPAGRRKKKCV
jgi:hypothetical protein